jgi:hypothetical protein
MRMQKVTGGMILLVQAIPESEPGPMKKRKSIMASVRQVMPANSRTQHVWAEGRENNTIYCKSIISLYDVSKIGPVWSLLDIDL